MPVEGVMQEVSKVLQARTHVVLLCVEADERDRRAKLPRNESQ
jgi:hypothetical protein